MDYTETVKRLDLILARGLSSGLGEAGKQVCVEAAICEALGLPHGDDPGCVDLDVRRYKITLNDSGFWKSPESRAAGMRDLAIAQLGSKGAIPAGEFSRRIAEKTIRVLIPRLFREIPVLAGNEAVQKAALRCENEGSTKAVHAAASAAYAAAAAADARAAAYAAARAAAYAADAADAAAADADATNAESYLLLSASLALEVLRELGSPGVAYL